VKTISLKKVAVVAVASLGFGLLSVVPANSVITSFYVSSKSVASGLVECAQTLTSSASTTITSGGGACLSDALTPAGTAILTDEDGFIGTIVTNTTAGGGTAATIAANSPTQAAAAASWYKGALATTTVATGVVADAISGMTVAAGAAGAFNIRGNAVATVNGAAKASIGGQIISGDTNTLRVTDDGVILPFTAPVAAGVYTVVIQVKDAANYAATDPTLNFTLTVTANPTYSNSLSQAYIVAGNAGTIATSATDLLPVVASRTAATTNAGSILINAFNTSGAAMATPGTVTVTVSGSGGLSSTFTNTTDTPTAGQCSATTNARVVTFTADAVNNVIICADGTAGVGTYTITVTNAAGVTTTLATKTVTFYGSVAKLEATAIYTIGTAGGGTTGDATGNRNATTIIPAVIIKATDSGNRPVPGLTISALSSDVTVVNSAITINADTAGATSSSGGAGFYNASFSTPSAAVSGAKATLTFRILDPADALGVAYLTAPVSISVGGAVATEVISFDKTAYAPGEAMVVTITAKDSAGNPVADGTASPAVTFSKAVGGTAPAASIYVGGKRSTSATAPTVFAPTIAGTFQALATSTNTAKSALSASSSVTDANAGLLTQIDALNAKIVALNALIAKIMKKLGVK
jgi:hypothetical protein